MIHVKTGPMFSSKSASLIERYNNIWNKEKVMCFKPKIDDRDLGIIKSRTSKEQIEAYCINDLSEILNYIKPNTMTIFIDEIQFLTGDVRLLLNLSINRDIDFYICGLNMTSEQVPFGIMPSVLAIADDIEILPASCFDCNKDAYFTYFKAGVKTDEVVVGSDQYIPLCANCLRKRYNGDAIKLEYKKK